MTQDQEQADPRCTEQGANQKGESTLTLGYRYSTHRHCNGKARGRWQRSETSFVCIRIYFDYEFSECPRAELSAHKRVLGLAKMFMGQKGHHKGHSKIPYHYFH